MRIETSTVTVIGTGQMGPGIGAVFALGGSDVTLVGRSAASAERGLKAARACVETLARHGLVAEGEAARGLARLGASTDLEEAVRDAGIVVESIPERLDLKQELFERLDRIASEAVLCSDTSGIAVSDIAARCRRPERVLTTHFWNPPHLMPLVEVVMGRKTELSLAEAVVEYLRRCGKTAVLVRKDVPGQLGNRVQQAMVRECMHIVAEGIASPEDVDLAVKAGVGLRTPVYGVFEHADLVGLDTMKAIQDIVVPDLSTVRGASPIHNEKVARGELGAKTGRGFLDWPPGKAERVRARRDAFLIEFLKLAKAGRFDPPAA